jgi:hypothetical protein
VWLLTEEGMELRRLNFSLLGGITKYRFLLNGIRRSSPTVMSDPECAIDTCSHRSRLSLDFCFFAMRHRILAFKIYLLLQLFGSKSVDRITAVTQKDILDAFSQ